MFREFLKRMVTAGAVQGIRQRFLAVVLFALIPPFILLLAIIASNRNVALDSARQTAIQLARLAAERQSRTLHEARMVLTSTRSMWDINAEGDASCRNQARGFIVNNPQFLTFGVVRADGTTVCHSIIEHQQAFSDVDVLHKALASDTAAFIVGQFRIGRITGKPTVTAAMPLPIKNGKATGIVFVTLNLDSFSKLAATLFEHSTRSVIAIEPETGTVVAHSSKRALIGQRYPDHALVRAVRANPQGGLVETEGLDGVQDIIGFAPLPGAETSGLVIAVSEPRSAALAQADRLATASLAVALSSALLVLAATWWLGLWTLVRPIRRLAKTAGRVGDGDFAARTALETWQAPELRVLGSTLDDMVARLGQAHHALLESELRYRSLAENTADLVTRLDADGRRTFASPSYREILGYDPQDLIGHSPEDLAHSEDRSALAALLQAARAGQAVSEVQYRARHRDGSYIWVEATARSMGDGGIVLVIRDISRRKCAEDRLAEANRELAKLAKLDGLTGLHNRRSFDAALENEFARGARTNQPVSVLLIDVDRFKPYNDTYGHPAGDQCLRVLGRTLAETVSRPADRTARYGGEEFAAILPNTDLAGATEIANQYRHAVEALNMGHTGSEYGVVTVSIGVVSGMPGRDIQRPVDLVVRSDAALYAAKAGGRNCVRTSGIALASAV